MNQEDMKRLINRSSKAGAYLLLYMTLQHYTYGSM